MPSSQWLNLIKFSRGQGPGPSGHLQLSTAVEFTEPKQAATWIPMAASYPPLASHPVGRGRAESQLGSLALAS